ncbi:MAG: ATP-grasp domain-containing protein [Alphaproteobacteria bacterium]|nr:ATP-grasp domain-containing protein [Alphaproteobacteria bacterium]
MAKSSTRIALLAGDETIDIKVIYCLHQVFKNIYIISNNEKSILRYTRYKKKFTYIPWSDKAEGQEKNIAEINNFCDENAIDFILFGDCNSSNFLDKYKDRFKSLKFFPTLARNTLENMDHKWLFSQILMKEGISTPHTLYIDTPEKLDFSKQEYIEKQIGYPLIVKPILSDGSLGVRKINNFEELRNHVFEKNAYNDLPLVIQKYIVGTDGGYSYLAVDGKVLAHSVQILKQEDELEFIRHTEIEELGSKIVELFKYNGAGNIDLRIESGTGKVYIFECNPRYWRSVNAAMWCGLNFPEQMVKRITGEKFEDAEALGHYTTAGKKIKSFIKKPWRYFSMSKNDRKDIWYNLLDIVPHFVVLWRHLKK